MTEYCETEDDILCRARIEFERQADEQMRNQLDENGLKQCPFCGGIPSLTHIQLKSEYEFLHYYVFCSACGNLTHQFVNFNHAVEAWNRRV
jgi:Lar family restriction alleviation protein